MQKNSAHKLLAFYVFEQRKARKGTEKFEKSFLRHYFFTVVQNKFSALSVLSVDKNGLWVAAHAVSFRAFRGSKT